MGNISILALYTMLSLFYFESIITAFLYILVKYGNTFHWTVETLDLTITSN